MIVSVAWLLTQLSSTRWKTGNGRRTIFTKVNIYSPNYKVRNKVQNLKPLFGIIIFLLQQLLREKLIRFGDYVSEWFNSKFTHLFLQKK